MAAGRGRPEDLREACVREALAIVAEQGVEGLSLREVARRLGVSHQAPYKHFPSRDHILAEMAARAFAAFAAHLESRAPGNPPHEDLAAMGRAYMDYALSRPLDYRLMFGTPLPNPADHPDMLRLACHAFDMLRQGIARAHAAEGRTVEGQDLDADALYVWSTLHGLAGILRGQATGGLVQVAVPVETVLEEMLARVGRGLGLRAGKT